MDNLKNKIEKIFEAPIPDSQMPSSHYMTDDRAFRAATKNVAPLLKQIQDYITNMSWSEITFQTTGSKNTVVLPMPLLALMSKMYLANSEYHRPIEVYGAGERQLTSIEKGLYNKIAHFNLSAVTVDANDPLGTSTSGVYVFKGVQGTGSAFHINMTCGRAGDRTHFPNNGINKGLKGLGQKLYRKLINTYGWVQTNSGGSGIKDLMWDSLTDFKYKSDGTTRDTDSEVYSFRFAGTLYALDTMQVPELLVKFGHTIINKVSDKNKLSSAQSRKDNGIAIDPDYIAAVKILLPQLPPSSKSLAVEMLDWLEPDPAVASERERIKREREEAEANARNAALATTLQSFCGVSRIQDLSSDWKIGSWVVLKHYLVNNSADIKIRKIVKKTGPEYAAIKNTDLPAFNSNGALNDVRTATESTRELWVTALPPAVGKDLPPGVYGVSADAPRETGAVTVTPAPTAAATTTTAATPDSTGLISSNIQSLFNTAAGIASTYNFDNTVRKRFLTRTINNNFLYLTQSIPADCKINGTPIFGYFVTGTNVKTLYNSKTMEDVRVAPTDWDAIQPLLAQYTRSPISDKRELTPGSLVFIKQHSKYFGYVAEVLSTSLTARGDKYVYLRVPGAGTGNRLTLTPVALDKLTRVVPNESSSKQYGTLFGKVFENYLEDAKTDLFDNK